MKRIDLLEGLIRNEITPDQADDICSEVLSDTSANTPANEILGMSHCEWTAYAQGAGFDTVAHWRAHGWPDSCVICGQKFIVDGFGWLVQEYSDELRLKHVVCPKVE